MDLSSLATPPRLHTVAPATWFRVYDSAYAPLSFNPNPTSTARFSAFQRPDGTTVASLYAGSSVKAALMETVFHEVPTPSARAILSRKGISGRRWTITSIEVSQPLTLVDLTSPGLQRIGLSRSDLIDTNATKYPVTQKFAKDLYIHFSKAQGSRWVSRLYDEGVCLVLWKDRIPSGSLVQSSAPACVLTEPTIAEIVDLADQLGMRYVI